MSAHGRLGDLGGGSGDIQLGHDRESGEPVCLRYQDRDRGVSIIGKSGTGKSSLLEHLVLADLEHGIPGMVIDPHGRLAERIVRLAPGGAARDVVLLEVNEKRPFGLNLLDVNRSVPDYVTLAADSVIEAVKKLYGETETFQPRLETYIDLGVRVVVRNNGTLVDVPRLFRDRPFRQTYLRDVTDRDVLAEFEGYDALRPGEQRTEVESVINRLARVCRSTAFKQILGSKTTTVPFDGILNGATMLIVSLPAEDLSEERCNFMGSLLLCAFKQRIMRRTTTVGEPPRVHLYLDEYQRFASRVTQDLLTQGRKYGAGITIAHQDLFSIKDPVVRNASRHAGTLVLLGLIRPDAEELAGEFPITPDPEWVETIEETVGTEPVYVLSPTPADDIYVEPHDDPEVDLAARSFFADERFFAASRYKSSGIHPRPGGVKVDIRVQLPLLVVRDFLTQAMTGVLSTDELFADRLFGDKSYPKPIFFHFANASPAIRQPEAHACKNSWFSLEYDPYQIYRGSPEIRRRPLCDCDIRRRKTNPADEAHNREVDRLYEECRPQQAERIRRWLMTYLQDRDALRADERTEAFKRADDDLRLRSDMDFWDGLWVWSNPLHKSEPGKLQPMMRLLFLNPASDHSKLSDIGRMIAEVSTACGEASIEAIDIMRQRLRWLVILAEGLERSPLYVQNGEQQPRKQIRHIVHGGQTHADALNEFAAKLVTPQARYVAHVKSPHGYFETQLRDALEGHGDSLQLVDVRQRSQALYCVADKEEDEPVTPPLSRGSPPKTPPVTRRGPGLPHAPGAVPVEPEPPAEEEPAMLEASAAVFRHAPETPPRVVTAVTEPVAGLTIETGGEELVASAKVDETDVFVQQSAAVVVEAEAHSPDDIIDAELVFEDVADEVALAALPPVRDYLCLGDYTPELFDVAVPGCDFTYLRDYRWFNEERFVRAGTILAAITSSQQAVKFFAERLKDVYNEDRALRGAHDNQTELPVHSGPGREHIERDGCTLHAYWDFDFGSSSLYVPPSTATDALAAFLQQTPHVDEVALVEFRDDKQHFLDPNYKRACPQFRVRFGRWHIAVATWEW